MIKAKLWDGKDLEGEWTVSLKIDGIRALRDADGNVVSRNGKPLYNLDHLDFVDAEVYCGSWEDTVSACRTKNGTKVSQECVYSLHPLDTRLYIATLTNPTAAIIKEMLESVVAEGQEGLVLRKDDKWLKVKTKETYDVPVTGYVLGKGKYTTKLGKVFTPMGAVGTGFTDKQREDPSFFVGKTIEVDCMELTPNGKFRHARFIRVREDK